LPESQRKPGTKRKKHQEGMFSGNRKWSFDAEEPYRGRNLRRGRETRVSKKNLEDEESQESCIRTSRVKPAGVKIPG
jgi:hypothetical protein